MTIPRWQHYFGAFSYKLLQCLQQGMNVLFAVQESDNSPSFLINHVLLTVTKCTMTKEVIVRVTLAIFLSNIINSYILIVIYCWFCYIMPLVLHLCSYCCCSMLLSVMITYIHGTYLLCISLSLSFSDNITK